ncbi:CHAP domain-containing protein [Kitasatospora gansuensis]
MSKPAIRRIAALATASAFLPVSMVLGAQSASASVGSSIVNIAQANIGDGACSTNSAGGTGFYSSCTGDASPENWCADFAKWVWSQSGVNVTGLTAGAGSFAQYNGGLHSTPHVGDAVVFNYAAGWASHVAIVASVNTDGTITTIGGNEGGIRGTYASTSHVRQSSKFSGAVGYSSYYGMRISGYASPIGGSDNTAPTTPPAATVPTTAHLFALGSDNRIYNDEGDYAAGKWSGYDMVDNTAGFKKTAAATVGTTVHLFAIGSDDRVYSNDGNYAAGSWNGYKLVDNAAGFKQITTAVTGNTVHLYAIGSDDRVYSNDGDYTTGSWSGFKLVDNTAGFKQITAAATGNTVHLYAIGSDDRVYGDNGDYATGSWSGFSQVDSTAGFSQITASATGNTVRLFAIGSDKRIYGDNGDYSAGKWSGFSQVDNAAGFNQIASVALGNTVHLYAIGADNRVYDNAGNYTAAAGAASARWTTPPASSRSPWRPAPDREVPNLPADGSTEPSAGRCPSRPNLEIP